MVKGPECARFLGFRHDHVTDHNDHLAGPGGKRNTLPNWKNGANRDIMQKTFLLGLGAQKAGTTWLYTYLQNHPQCAPGKIKELAALGMYFGGEPFNMRWQKRVAAVTEALQNAPKQIGEDFAENKRIKELLESFDYLASCAELGAYVRYYERQLAAAPGAHVVADITPEYCMLSEDNLRETKATLEAAGFAVKAVFLMRDPVERCYSAMRMAFRRDRKAGVEEPRLPNVDFVNRAARPGCQKRTRYEKIVPRIEAVFAPEERFIGFHEEFFSAGSLGQVCDLLQIDQVPARLNKRINTSPREVEPSAEEWAQVRELYSETYTFCEKRFGAEKIAGLWPVRSSELASQA